MKQIVFLLVFFSGLFAGADDQKILNDIELDNVDSIRDAVNAGKISVNHRVVLHDAPGTPIISLAAKYAAEKIALYLISKQADLNAQNPVKETALMMAVFFDNTYWGGTGYDAHDRIARALINAGAALENGDWWEPLAYAAYKGRFEIAAYLISKGARVNGPTADGVSPVNTPLMMASMQGHENFVRFLLANNANAKIKNQHDLTAFMLAKKYNQTHLFKYLKCAETLKPGEKYLDHCE